MADSSKPSTSNTNPDQGKLWLVKKNLFDRAMQGQWGEVLQIYTDNPWIHDARITRSGATALHIAVSDGKEDIVEELIQKIRINNSETWKVLSTADELGNTPLHTAATLGKEKMCTLIASVNKCLIGIRNKDGETPFFMAALHGHKDAFLCLHDLCKDDGKGYEYGRRNDGETILHCAISGDYFDLAFQIIHLYENLVNSVNEVGSSPLHVLAAKPTTFRSGTHLGRCNALIYHCIFVDELKEAKKSNNQSSTPKRDEEEPFYPPNYETCHHLIRLLWKAIKAVTSTACNEEKPDSPDAENPESHQLFPPNYSGWFEFVKLVSKAMLIVLGLGSNKIRKLREKKQKHTWSAQVMNELLQRASMYEHENEGKKPLPSLSGQEEEDSEETKPYDVDAGGETIFAFGEDASDKNGKPLPTNNIASRTIQNEKDDAKDAEDRKKTADMKVEVPEMEKEESPILIEAKNGITDIVEKIREMFPVAIHDMNHPNKNVVLLAMENRQPHVYQKESPVLIAAKNGITEIVEKILKKFPVAIHDMNYQNKNVVLLAVENRQPHIYQLLLNITNMKESVFRKVDYEGNSALHLAARLGEHKPWLIPGAALQMQWEIKWYEFVKESMPFHFFVRYNKQNKSPKEIFTESHKELVAVGGEWLTNTSESCSVVAALIATVAFATSTAVPGGVNEESGTPTLENQPAFDVFAISSLVALCFSVTSVVMFLAILTSRYQEQDFGKDLPRKLLVGLTSLFVSIGSMLISFCAGHFFVLKDKLKYAAWPVYAVTCLPITFFAIAQFPLYFDLIWASFKKVPQRSYKSIPN